jgi:hypothetical protein
MKAAFNPEEESDMWNHQLKIYPDIVPVVFLHHMEKNLGTEDPFPSYVLCHQESRLPPQH